MISKEKEAMRLREREEKISDAGPGAKPVSHGDPRRGLGEL